MIKKKITKNINTKVSPFQFEISQIIIGIIGFAAAIGTYFLLRDYIVFDGLIWIILLELMLVVGFGVVKINDIRLLNSLPPDVEYQEFIMNTEIDTAMLERALIPPVQNPNIDRALYQDYCKVMKSYIDETNDGSARKIMLAALSYRLVNKIDNANFLTSSRTVKARKQPVPVTSLRRSISVSVNMAALLPALRRTLPKYWKANRLKECLAMRSLWFCSNRRKKIW